MGPSRLTNVTILTLALGAAAGSLRAQPAPVAATADQDLRFGAVLPGLAAVVSRTDAVNAGRFQIRGAKNAEVVVQLTLPTEMNAPGGAQLPLSFGNADGGFGTRPAIGASQSFDPDLPLVAQLSRSGRLYLWLGGTAQPLPTQAPGDYTATITVTVAYTGN
jgi:hypothetical protein